LLVPALAGRTAAQVRLHGSPAAAAPVAALQQRPNLLAGQLAGLAIISQARAGLGQHLADRTGPEIQRGRDVRPV
jgi:hypothetical protein